MDLDLLPLAVPLAVVLAVAASFTVSASAGLGGSLILVPVLVLVVGPKEGVALAALLLAANNVVKVLAYRRTLPLRAAAAVVALTVLGAAVGARLLLAAPERWVALAVLAGVAASFVAERQGTRWLRPVGAPALALAAGATSGVSGTSGPLKGVAVRSLRLDRLHTVGAASLASLAGDVTKTAVFAEASLLDAGTARLALAAAPVMVLATLTGRRITRAVGENGYTVLFWLVLCGYGVRLVAP